MTFSVDRRRLLRCGAAAITTISLRGMFLPGIEAPAGSNRPEPVDLGKGVSLVDYRMHPGPVASMIGELKNNTGQMIDAPVVSIDYTRTDGVQGFMWLPPVIPVIAPESSVPLFGSILIGDMDVDRLRPLSFSLCTDPHPGEYTAIEETYKFDIENRKDVLKQGFYHFEGDIRNLTDEKVRHFSVRGIVRDHDDRMAGMLGSNLINVLFPGLSRFVMLSVAADDSHIRANPFPLLTGAEYDVEIRVGAAGSVVAPGCSFGLPWDN